MRINSMDASNSTIATGQSSSRHSAEVSIKDNVIAPQVITRVAERKSISHLTEAEKKELPISDKVVIDAIERANKAIMGANTKFEFSIHESTKAIMVKVIDSDTNKIIREIPPEKILDMVAKMWEMAGLIVDERR